MATELGTVYVLRKGKMTCVRPVSHERAARPNFVIVCEYGDWSGFRTLKDCEKQFHELEEKGRPDGFFWVEER